MKRKIFLMTVIMPCIAFAVVALFSFKESPKQERPKQEQEVSKLLPGLITESHCYTSPQQRDDAYNTALNVTHQYHLIMDNDSYEQHIPGGGEVYCYVIKYYA